MYNQGALMNFGSLASLRTVGTLTTKIAIIAAATLGGASLVSSSVFAALTATATPNNSVASGTLALVQTSHSTLTAGLTTNITAMAPGDTVNRYIELVNSGLSNNGNLDGKALTLRLSDSSTTALTSDAVKGLQITIQECSVVWVGPAGTCSGTTTTVLSATAAALIANPIAVTVSSVISTVTNHLKISTSLPAGNEVTANGVLPVGSVQGKTATLTWTFVKTLRDTAGVVTTNS